MGGKIGLIHDICMGPVGKQGGGRETRWMEPPTRDGVFLAVTETLGACAIRLFYK